MQEDSTQVTVDKAKDPFKDFGPTIVGNIVSYSSSSKEEEEQIKDYSQKGDEVEKLVVETKVTTPTSTPITHVTPSTPSTPPAPIEQVHSNDEAKA